MSYIRTKDRICTLSEAYWAGIEDETIAQADTIEELCDGIAMTYTEYETEYYVYEKLDDIPLLDLKCKNKYFNIYGFIGTDKGLIYVAKMNEKGELELL